MSLYRVTGCTWPTARSRGHWGPTEDWPTQRYSCKGKFQSHTKVVFKSCAADRHYLYSSSPSVLTIQSPTVYQLPSFCTSDLQALAKRSCEMTKDVTIMRFHMVYNCCVLKSVTALNDIALLYTQHNVGISRTLTGTHRSGLAMDFIRSRIYFSREIVIRT